MIRTRDFFLYLVALFFVILAATHTGFSKTVGEELRALVKFGTPSENIAALTNEDEDARLTRLTALKSQIAAGEGVVSDAPPDFESVDQRRAAEAASTSPENGFVGDRTAQYCGAPVAPLAVQTWPRDNTLRLSEGEWVVFENITETVTIGSTTGDQLVEVPYLALPIRSVRTGFDTCLPDTLIGVTTAGQPLRNENAGLYAGFAETAVIGYTRDGFTVYGPVADASVLDSCGGQYVNGRYQYHVRTGEPFVIACYAGIPVEL